MAGPLLGGVVESNIGPRAAEQLYEAPAGVGILVGMLAYFAASFVLHVARFSTEDVRANRTTMHDIKKRNQADSGGAWPPPPTPPSPWPAPTNPPNNPPPRVPRLRDDRGPDPASDIGSV